jgi:hypothetical protein
VDARLKAGHDELQAERPPRIARAFFLFRFLLHLRPYALQQRQKLFRFLLDRLGGRFGWEG